ncbi:group 1 glycosyl transferase [Hyphomicrobium denitrificans 1NES1]|uniref:Group 1 glycosyl transferase n=1 Tax=Hyphomicrobium denitrificans 1NES1 TaxID=670307 RepID=N0B8C6_9HYPH|nr:glycosyltransferase family 4 protein [Hyphomicrobium denitrificans]AGK56315.1 group 1 glycosyl transferase [Hyphomicrobium denitrificans 1NES1]
MRILILTQFFTPEPTIKNIAFAKALAAAGHEVRVLTGFPNYPGGKIYDGYRLRLVRHEIMDGIPVTRVPLYCSHDSSRLRRSANYISFAASASVAGLFTRWRPDVMYVYHPPLTVGLAAALTCFLRQIPFAYDIQDLWPDTLKATGMIGNDRLLAIIGYVARFVYRRASMVMPQSPGFAARLKAVGVAPEKIRVVYNWANEASMQELDAGTWTRSAELEGKFLLVFAGTMGMAQKLENVLDAMALLQVQVPQVALLCIGGGVDVPQLKARAQALRLRNTHFHPAVPMSEIGGVLRAADALLVHLRRDPLFDITIPSKTQAYLLAGKPIVMAVQGDAAALIEEADAGLVVEQEDPQSLADAVMQLASMTREAREAMGQRGKTFYATHMSASVGVKSILSAMELAVTRFRS